MASEADLREYDTVRILVPVHLNLRNRDVSPGTEGIIVDITTNSETGKKGYTVEFSFPNESLVGGLEFDVEVFTADQLERV